MWIGLPNLRKSHQPQKLILDVNGLPSLRVRLRCDPIDKWERAHPAAAALIHTLLQEHRVETRLSRKVETSSSRAFTGPEKDAGASGSRKAYTDVTAPEIESPFINLAFSVTYPENIRLLIWICQSRITFLQQAEAETPNPTFGCCSQYFREGKIRSTIIQTRE